jgi:hypothetical protein
MSITNAFTCTGSYAIMILYGIKQRMKHDN